MISTTWCRRKPRMGYLRWKFAFRRELRGRQRRRWVTARWPLTDRRIERLESSSYTGGPYPPPDEDHYRLWVPTWARTKRRKRVVGTEQGWAMLRMARHWWMCGRPERSAWGEFNRKPRW